MRIIKCTSLKVGVCMHVKNCKHQDSWILNVVIRVVDIHVEIHIFTLLSAAGMDLG